MLGNNRLRVVLRYNGSQGLFGFRMKVQGFCDMVSSIIELSSDVLTGEFIGDTLKWIGLRMGKKELFWL